MSTSARTFLLGFCLSLAASFPAAASDIVGPGAPLHPSRSDGASARNIHSGVIQTAVLLANFPDFQGEPFTPAYAADLVFNASNSLNAYFQENSYGRNSLAGTVYGWFTMPHDLDTYCTDFGPNGQAYTCSLFPMAVDADAIAQGLGYNGSLVDRTILVFYGMGAAGFGGGTAVWMGASTGFKVHLIAHELGHTMGAMHAGTLGCPIGPPNLDNVDADCSVDRYGDIWDAMGVSTRHFSSYHKDLFGFLDPARVATASTSGQFTLNRFELPSSGFQELRVPLDANRFYFFEYRKPIGFDAGVNEDGEEPPDGVLVRLRANSTVTDVDTMLLPPELHLGRGFVDPFHGVAVTVTAESSTQVTLTVDRDWDDDSIPGSWSAETVDPASRSGEFNAIAVDSSCNLHIAYLGNRGRALLHASRAAAGGPWVLEDVDTVGRISERVSLAADGTGGLHAAYYRKDGIFRDLKYAYKASGAGWTTETVDGPNKVGKHSSIAVEAGGTVHIAYYDETNRDLLHASRAPGGSWQTETVDDVGRVGERTAIAVAPSGDLHITYFDVTNRWVKHAMRSPGGPWTLEIVDPTVNAGGANAAAVDGQGDLHVAYYDAGDKNLRYARRTAGGVWTRETIDASHGVGSDVALAVDPSGAPVSVVYRDASARILRYAIRPAAGGWTLSVADPSSDVGLAPSLALGCGATAGVHASYYDHRHRTLKHAGAPSTFTVPASPDSHLILVGDFNQDGVVGFGEALRLAELGYGATPTPEELVAVDSNGNGVFDSQDQRAGQNNGSHFKPWYCMRHTSTNRRFYLVGDLDQDGTVTRRELARVGNHAQGLGGSDPREVLLGDADVNGQITLSDVTLAVDAYDDNRPLRCVEVAESP